MKPHPPALTPSAVAVTAGKKALQVKRKLRAAKVELRASAECLQNEGVVPHPEDALKHNMAAEGMVDEATEELEVVEELLSDAAAKGNANRTSRPGRTGEGAKSVIRHLRHG